GSAYVQAARPNVSVASVTRALIGANASAASFVDALVSLVVSATAFSSELRANAACRSSSSWNDFTAANDFTVATVSLICDCAEAVKLLLRSCTPAAQI